MSKKEYDLNQENLNISESGLALILLENEISNNWKELHRWELRLIEANNAVQEARQRIHKNTELLNTVLSNLNVSNTYAALKKLY